MTSPLPSPQGSPSLHSSPSLNKKYKRRRREKGEEREKRGGEGRGRGGVPISSTVFSPAGTRRTARITRAPGITVRRGEGEEGDGRKSEGRKRGKGRRREEERKRGEEIVPVVAIALTISLPMTPLAPVTMKVLIPVAVDDDAIDQSDKRIRGEKRGMVMLRGAAWCCVTGA